LTTRASDTRNRAKESTMSRQSRTKPMPPQEQRDALLESERAANRDEPRNFKEDALTDKVVSVEPDGTGPTSTETFDAPQDRQRRNKGKGA
jgi:hypothetical protein